MFIFFIKKQSKFIQIFEFLVVFIFANQFLAPKLPVFDIKAGC